MGKTGGVGTSWTERLQARSATQQINAVPQGRHYGALRGIHAEGVTENADRRLQAGEDLPLPTRCPKILRQWELFRDVELGILQPKIMLTFTIRLKTHKYQVGNDVIMVEGVDIAEQFERHLNSPKQTWLLGAGVSFPANIPLMFPLTERVLEIARNDLFKDDDDAKHILEFIENDCGNDSHIEHHLTHLGDLISLSERSHVGEATVGDKQIAKEKLLSVHTGLIETIASTVRWGFRAARKNDAGEVTDEAQIGSQGESIVDIAGHQKFINAVFGTSRAGLDFVRTPVEIFTTNYDTLVEDALALASIEFKDGFTGGGVGFWNPRNYDNSSGARAIVSKLHGSIDWYRLQSGNSNLLRVRHGDTYPGSGGSVMIYPQATKYVNTQRDPFAEIFQRFRHRLSQGSDHVLLICGYSFGDEHINAEIEIAMSSVKNQLTIVAFADEPGGVLPTTLGKWLSESWGQRLFVASPKGIYQGSTGPVFPSPDGKRNWWTFDGVATLLDAGLPKDIQEAMA